MTETEESPVSVILADSDFEFVSDFVLRFSDFGSGGSGGVVAGGPLRGNNLSGVVAGAAGAGRRLGAGTPKKQAAGSSARSGGVALAANRQWHTPVQAGGQLGDGQRDRGASPSRDAGSLSPVRPLPCGLVAGRGRGKFRPRPVPGSVIGDRATET